MVIGGYKDDSAASLNRDSTLAIVQLDFRLRSCLYCLLNNGLQCVCAQHTKRKCSVSFSSGFQLQPMPKTRRSLNYVHFDPNRTAKKIVFDASLWQGMPRLDMYTAS